MKKCKVFIIELLAFIVYLALLIIVSCFHEQWFDEAQVWQIAKCCSYKDILFNVPHYEGHPALWTLILSIPAKMGLPYLISIKAIGFLIFTCSLYLIIFKSPFPTWLKIIIPSNYFFFYQYGIIVRPYGLMLLVFLLLAINYKNRNEKPFWYIFLLTLLAMTSAYGLLFAFGIALCFTIEIIKEKGFIKAFSEIIKDRRSRALVFLLIISVLIVAQIIPREDTMVASNNPTNSLFERIIALVFVMPGECFIYSSPWFSNEGSNIQSLSLEGYALYGYAFVGLFFWLMVFCLSNIKNIKEFVLPFLAFALFGAIKYFGVHHVGLTYLLFLYWGWIAYDDMDFALGWRKLSVKLKATAKDKKILETMGTLLLAASLIIPLYWTVASVITEMSWDYGCGSKEYKFLVDNNLTDYNIFSGWSYEDKNGRYVIDGKCLGGISTFLAYSDGELIKNTLISDYYAGFTQYRYLSDEEIEATLNKWKSLPLPEILYGKADVEFLTDGEFSVENDYSIVFVEYYGNIWKGNHLTKGCCLYARNDIVEKLGLETVEFEEQYSLEITPELREAYLKGEITMDEILDSIFGDSTVK